MFSFKILSYFLVLSLVYETTCKPVTNNVIEGRGIGSTIWGWVTYPFSWWTSNAEIPPESNQLIGTIPSHNIEIAKHNVTVWCNDQTCTTMRCDKYGCVNVTCNIYDTDLTGECRHYNTLPNGEKPPPASPSPEPKPTQSIETEVTSKDPVASTTVQSNDGSQTIEERPLELEAVLSSTVTKNPVKINP